MAELKLNEKGETGCCPKFNPEPWDEKTIEWKDKLFVKDHVRSFLHIPLNMGKVITKNLALIEKAEAKGKYQLMLSDEKSPWGSDIYIAVSKNVPDTEMAKLSGVYLSKVYDGPFKDAGKWMQDMAEYVKSKDKIIKKIYLSYTTCPACAKKFGHNYVVVLAQIK